jgi:hypothetical protein
MNGRSDSGPGTERPSGAGEGRSWDSLVAVLSSIIELLKNRATEAIVVAIIAVAGAAFWASWDYLKAQTKGFIVSVTVEELNKEQNRLLEPLKKTLTELRSKEIGALSVGNFALTPSNPQYVLPIYMPKDHEGQLSVLLSGDLVPSRSYVVLMLPNGKKFEIKNNETTINLSEFLRMEAASPSGLPEDFVVRPEFIKGLRTLTFQLAGDDTGPDAQPGPANLKTERAIFVRYLAMVSPTLKMGKAQ